MNVTDAVALVESIPFQSGQKNAIARGFAILAKYHDDLDVNAGHDILYVGGGILDAFIEAMSADDIGALARLNWFIDVDNDCWSHYI